MSDTRMTDAKILERVPNLSALIVGDICLDRWCHYDPALSEASRETGIPRTAVISTEVTPGGAGTIANNLAALRCGRVSLLGALGDDGHGFELMRSLNARGISTEYVYKSSNIPTFTYTKLINAQTGVEDLPRVDYVQPPPPPAEIQRHVLNTLQAVFDNFNIIFIADQAETGQGGLITDAVRNMVEELAQVYSDKIFIADSRTRVADFRRVIVKPNQQEAEEASMKLIGRIDYPEMRRKLRAPMLLVTHGAAGVSIYRPDCVQEIQTTPVENPVDICGAGDSFSAGFGLALAVTGDPARAAEFGNKVASITIMKVGTGTASPDEILRK